jgi:NAD(P)-dependent dehydrogenase (short-subunit alcohol dehydrogenase family)
MTFYPGRFTGRSAIITGGASGLGLVTAKRIVREGGRVSLWDCNRESLEAAKEAIGADHIQVVDVTDPTAVAHAAQATAEALHTLDILVASAGITGATAPVHEYCIESWKQVLDINLNGLFYCCRAIVPLLMANGYGRIINIASVAGKEGNPNASAYSASKAGVIGFTKSLGKELAAHGILVNCVTPATFDSPMLEQLPASQVDYMRSKIPMGRLGDPAEVAAMVCWLASEECSFSTAATFDASGGRTTY